MYFHPVRKISYFHWGDDFVVVGMRKHTQWLRRHVSQTLIVKERGTLGPRATDLKEITILHRTVRWLDAIGGHDTCIEYCADPGHAEVLMHQCGLGSKSAKGVVTPAEKITPTPENLQPLSEHDCIGYRSACMRAGYLALDRGDIQFAAKECARGMSQPIVRHGLMLKRLVRYLVLFPNMVWVF